MNKKQFYSSPETEVVQVRLEGVIAASAEITGVNNPFSGNTELDW